MRKQTSTHDGPPRIVAYSHALPAHHVLLDYLFLYFGRILNLLQLVFPTIYARIIRYINSC
jgi:hypothetical protein